FRVGATGTVVFLVCPDDRLGDRHLTRPESTVYVHWTTSFPVYRELYAREEVDASLRLLRLGALLADLLNRHLLHRDRLLRRAALCPERAAALVDHVHPLDHLAEEWV